MQAEPVENLEYAGFWIRFVASVIDSVLVLMVTAPILFAIYGEEYLNFTAVNLGAADLLVTRVLPAIAIVVFWIYRAATPGKMVFATRIVDARTGAALSTGQCIGRYLGYYVSIFTLGLGFLWVAIDPRKQGFHDKLAGTVVVRVTKTGENRVTFEG